MYKIRTEDYLQFILNKLNNMKDEYVQLLAEYYEAEDEFWKDLFEDLEAGYGQITIKIIILIIAKN